MAQPKQLLLGGVLLVGIATGVFLLQSRRDASQGHEKSRSVEITDKKPAPTGKAIQNVPTTGASAEEIALKEDSAGITDAIREEMKHTIESKRAFLRTDYRNFQTPVADYNLDNTEITAEGIRLKAPKDPNDPIRIGVVESPGLPLQHPSNSVVPLWRSEVPDNTSMQVEIAVSADNKDWSRWYHLDAGHEEISPTFPDGSPNPNYGAQGAQPVGFGMALYPYVKYRVTMSSSGAESPTLQAMDFYHNDSTDGAGYLANNPPPEQAILDAAAEQAASE